MLSSLGMNASTPPSLVCSNVFWKGPMILPIEESLVVSSQDLRSTEAASETAAASSSLMTFPPDLHRPNYEHFDIRSFLDCQSSTSYQVQSLESTVPHAERVSGQISRPRNSHEVVSGSSYAMNFGNEGVSADFSETSASNFIGRHPQSHPSVPLLPFFEFTEFYPEAASPKAAVNDYGVASEYGESEPSNVWYNQPSRPTTTGSTQMVDLQAHNTQSFGVECIIDDQQSIAVSAEQSGSTFEATLAPSQNPSMSTDPYIRSHSRRPFGSSGFPFTHRGSHTSVASRQRTSPYNLSHSRAKSPTMFPQHAVSSLAPHPHVTQSLSGGSLGSASTPTLSVSPSLSSPMLNQTHNTTAGVMLPPHSEQRINADVSHRPSLRHEPTITYNAFSDSPLHGLQLLHRLGAGVTSGQPPGDPSTPAVVPQLLLSPPSTPPSSLPRDVAQFLSISFRDPPNWWRRLVLDSVMQSSFLRNDELEPQDRGSADPITMGFGKSGRSIYGVFIEEFTKGKWKCLFGNETSPCPNNAVFKRFERAVEHVRSHLNHRPYKCDGTCNPEATACQRRFFAHQYLRDHLTRKGKTPCIICGRSVLTQNMSRHNQLRHPQSRS